jgi:hypothetical protein
VTNITMGAPEDDPNNTIASTTARCLLKPDSLVKALCKGVGPPPWLLSADPMLDELAPSPS